EPLEVRSGDLIADDRHDLRACVDQGLAEPRPEQSRRARHQDAPVDPQVVAHDATDSVRVMVSSVDLRVSACARHASSRSPNRYRATFSRNDAEYRSSLIFEAPPDRA